MDLDTMIEMFYRKADTVGQGLLTYDDPDLATGRSGENITYDQDQSNVNVYNVTYDAERQ